MSGWSQRSTPICAPRRAPGRFDRLAGLVEDAHVADRPRGARCRCRCTRAPRGRIAREVVADAAAAAHGLGRLASARCRCRAGRRRSPAIESPTGCTKQLISVASRIPDPAAELIRPAGDEAATRARRGTPPRAPRDRPRPPRARVRPAAAPRARPRPLRARAPHPWRISPAARRDLPPAKGGRRRCGRGACRACSPAVSLHEAGHHI